MKIKVKEASYEKVMAMTPFKNKRPESQGHFYRWLIKALSKKGLKKDKFQIE